jgi:hypothetical protein
MIKVTRRELDGVVGVLRLPRILEVHEIPAGPMCAAAPWPPIHTICIKQRLGFPEWMI